jgi:small-conductance mechanosensitive channel
MEPTTTPDAASPTHDYRALWESLPGHAEAFLQSVLHPWNAFAVGLALALLLLAHLLGRSVQRRTRSWLTATASWPRWRQRLVLVLHQRLRGILFVLFIWFAVVITREAAGPARATLLGILANLSTAWLIVTLATRLIANNLLRNLVRQVALVWVTLNILGLTEDTVRLLDSIALEAGQLRLSLWLVLQAALILGLLFVGARVLARTSANRIAAQKDISPSMQVLLVKLLQVGLYGAAFLLGLRAVGVDLSGLAVLSGAIGLGLGFGLQKVVSNLVSGFIILLDKSVKPGDVISLGDTFGWIDSLGARYVSVVTRDGREYLIPNEDLITGQVVNWSHSNEFVRIDLTFGTSYQDNPHLVREVAVKAARGVPRVLTDREIRCHITGFGDSSIDYVLRFWITDAHEGLAGVKGGIYLALWDAFKEHGITIPFPQREVKLLEGSRLRAERES